MEFSFKQFLNLSEDQLDELFGKFRNNPAPAIPGRPGKTDPAKSEQDKEVDWKIAKAVAEKKRRLTPAETQKIKDKIWSDAKFKNSSSPIDVKEEHNELIHDGSDDGEHFKVHAVGDGKYTIEAELNGELRHFSLDWASHKFTNEKGEDVRKPHPDLKALSATKSHLKLLHKLAARHLNA